MYGEVRRDMIQSFSPVSCLLPNLFKSTIHILSLYPVNAHRMHSLLSFRKVNIALVYELCQLSVLGLQKMVPFFSRPD
jgi:hypothetical protein